MHREPAHLWSTRVKRVVIMPILSYALPPRATQFSDCNALVCRLPYTMAKVRRVWTPGNSQPAP